MTQHAQPATGERPGGFRVTGRMVLLTFIGFFAVVASVNASWSRQPSDLASALKRERLQARARVHESIAAAVRAGRARLACRDRAPHTPTAPTFTVTACATNWAPSDRRPRLRRLSSIRMIAVVTAADRSSRSAAGCFRRRRRRKPGFGMSWSALSDGETPLFRSAHRIVVS